jgi:benzodiazapine receptor
MDMVVAAPSRGKSLLGLVGWLALCFLAAFVGSSATFGGLREWYPTLNKPSFNPPNWIFGPVWSTLYTLMAISAWLVWRERGFSRGAWPLGLFLVQLVLNALWSIVFFGMRNPGAAFAELVLFWVAIAATMAAFFPIKRLAGVLLVPYLAWVSFAGVLNFMIWRLNS